MEDEVQDHDGGIESSSRVPYHSPVSTPAEPWNPSSASTCSIPIGCQARSTEDNMPAPSVPSDLPNASFKVPPHVVARNAKGSTGSGPNTLSNTTSKQSLSHYELIGYGGNRSSVSESSPVGAIPSLASVYSYSSSSSYPETMQCPHEGCELEFTGPHRRGTLHRHMRLKHATAHGSTEQERKYFCHVRGCDRDYRRQDALLKHQRHNHPELSIPPPKARKPEVTVTDLSFRTYFMH
jgi:hypothetical protein